MALRPAILLLALLSAAAPASAVWETYDEARRTAQGTGEAAMGAADDAYEFVSEIARPKEAPGGVLGDNAPGPVNVLIDSIPSDSLCINEAGVTFGPHCGGAE